MNRPFDLGSTLLRDATEADAHLPDPTRECTITNSYTNKNIEKTTSADMAPCRQLSSSVVNVVKQGTEHTDLARAAKHLIKGGADLLFVEKTLQSIALGQTRPFPLHDIPAIITSASELAGRRERNLTAEVREWILSSSGVFLSSEIAKVSSLSSRDDLKHLSTILRRFVQEGLIERHGDRNGCFRVRDDRAEDIDFRNAPTESLPIHWPFEIETLVRTLPRNIIVVAGSPNSGKTAFLLNVVRLNMEEHRVHYFSSEMGAQELRDRLSKFELPLEAWSFAAKERSSNFADVIRPDEVNIIDFLEVHENFYQVGAWIKEIFDKLRNGIAVVALQKNPGSDVGLGGQRSVEKARLYLSMEPGLIKIVKAKNWENPGKNPNGMEMRFKLVKGCRFQHDGYWKRP